MKGRVSLEYEKNIFNQIADIAHKYNIKMSCDRDGSAEWCESDNCCHLPPHMKVYTGNRMAVIKNKPIDIFPIAELSFFNMYDSLHRAGAVGKTTADIQRLVLQGMSHSVNQPGSGGLE